MLDLGALARRLRVHGRTLHLSSPQRQVSKLIELVGLSRLPGVALDAAPAALAQAR
jgi:anti-anti-sigma regulatory factor